MDYTFERRGTTITMNNAAIENSGVLGALLYGYDVGNDVKAYLTMQDASITAGEGTAIIVPFAHSTPILLRPQLGLAAVGAGVTVPPGKDKKEVIT